MILSAMAATELMLTNATSVLHMQSRMNTEDATVIGSGWAQLAISSYTRDHVIQFAIRTKDVPDQQPLIVMPATSTHSVITTELANVKHTGLEKTVEHTPLQDIVMLSVMVAALDPQQPTASNAYHILIVIATQLASVTTTGPEMTVVYVSTWKPVTQFVTTAMVV